MDDFWWWMSSNEVIIAFPVVFGGVQSMSRRKDKVLFAHRKEVVCFQTVPRWWLTSRQCFVFSSTYRLHTAKHDTNLHYHFIRWHRSEIGHLESILTRCLSTVDIDCWYFLDRKSSPLFESGVHSLQIDSQSIPNTTGTYIITPFEDVDRLK